MPRRPRIQVVDGIFHVATRAVDGAMAYRETADRLDFLDLLWRTLVTYEWLCQSYCLMGTHYHLIVQTQKENLAAGMQFLNGRYAQRFNWRHDRRGHLFGGRFGSVHVTTDRQLLAAHRYVARNPVRAGLCATPTDWRWSSARSTAGLAMGSALIDTSAVLRLMGAPSELARAAYSDFVATPPPSSEIVVDPLAVRPWPKAAGSDPLPRTERTVAATGIAS